MIDTPVVHIEMSLGVENSSDAFVFQEFKIISALRIWSDIDTSVPDLIKFELVREIGIRFINMAIDNKAFTSIFRWIRTLFTLLTFVVLWV